MIKKIKFKKYIQNILYLTSLLIFTLMSSIPAQAVSDFFSDSNIQFYDPNACDPIGSTNASGTNDAIGGVTFTTEMNINTDGSGESHGNTFHQTETSFTNGGRPLNADELNFIALSPPWAESKNLKLGDLALVEYKDKKIFAIYGDNWNNSGEVHGEGSYRMAQILSDSENPNINVAIPSPVKYTIFPESHKKLPSSFDQSKVDGLGAEISGFSSSSTINESSFNNVCCPGGQGPNLNIGPVSLSGDTDAEKAFNFFVQKGMSKSGAAGVVGNLMRESGGDTYNLNTRAFNAAGFTGIVQWDNRRWVALQSYAAANKKDRYDLITQLEYIWIELTKGDLERNENQYKDLLNFLKNSPEDEASAIAAAEKVYAPGTGYERANHGLVERKENAKKAFEDFKDNPSGPGSAEISNIPSSTCCAIPGGGLSDSLPSSIPSYWRELINNAASKYPNSDPRLVAAVLWAENRGWPDPNKNWGVSSAGAKGPWQFIDSTWASMGQDGDGDGVKDPNNPKDAVLAAYIHHNGSKGKPLVEGFSGSAESYFNQATFQRNGKNLLSFGASYNGSGAPNGVKLKDFPRNENSDYVKMVYWLIGSNFEKGWSPEQNKVVDAKASSSSSSESSLSTSCNKEPLTSLDGFTFPVGGLKKSEVGANNKLPCNNPDGCHHDGTAAFDLGKSSGSSGILIADDSSVGLPVYAIEDGSIQSYRTSYNGIAGCPTWQLVGKSGWWYWYGHTANPNIRLGSNVKSGDTISKIGPRKCTGNGSMPHLHIDRGAPRGHYGGSVSARDKSMVNLINKLWEALPD